MHDPCTVAFTIKSPFVRELELAPGEKSHRYRPTLVTIWHVDPREDACGWAWDRATDADRALAKKLAMQEFEFWTGKYVQSACGGIAFSAHELIWWAWKLISIRRTRNLGPLSRSEEDRIQRLASNPHDNIRLTVLHTGTLEGLEKLFLAVDRIYRTHHRPWYRHPRWHFWHWRIQLHPLETLRAWLFNRCQHCGKRFAWGYSPIAMGWSEPRSAGRFKGQSGLYHHTCSSVAWELNQARQEKSHGVVH